MSIFEEYGAFTIMFRYLQWTDIFILPCFKHFEFFDKGQRDSSVNNLYNFWIQFGQVYAVNSHAHFLNLIYTFWELYDKGQGDSSLNCLN